MHDPLGAFCPDDQVRLSGAPSGPLKGVTFAAKDIYDVVGRITGAGNPRWRETHPVASKTAWAVQAMLDAGADLVGETITDELAFSLNGENHHYGTPKNPNAPGRIPGGSSAGSASAVAGSLVDTALGSDTGGSVRAPASFCGLYGIRTTLDLLSLDGVVPLAPSFDTVGWFARDGSLFARVGEVLLGMPVEGRPDRIIVPDDLWAIAREEVREALRPGLAALETLIGSVEHITLAGDTIGTWFEAFRRLQWREIAETHGAWIDAANPRFGPGVADRFVGCRLITDEEVAEANAVRNQVSSRLNEVTGANGILVYPTVPDIAPLRGMTGQAQQDFRAAAMRLLCPAGLARLPQVNLPVGTVDGCPVGLSITGPAKTDAMLLSLARDLPS